jgi:drug/metabolite transporter (DMT)-like permease
MFMAIFPAVLSSLIYYYALTYLPASRVSGVLYLQPLLATLLAAATIGEPVGISLAIGGILILIGVYSTEHAGNPTANVLSSTAEE